jgi:hypothetical protein
MGSSVINTFGSCSRHWRCRDADVYHDSSFVHLPAVLMQGKQREQFLRSLGSMTRGHV